MMSTLISASRTGVLRVVKTAPRNEVCDSALSWPAFNTTALTTTSGSPGIAIVTVALMSFAFAWRNATTQAPLLSVLAVVNPAGVLATVTVALGTGSPRTPRTTVPRSSVMREDGNVTSGNG